MVFKTTLKENNNTILLDDYSMAAIEDRNDESTAIFLYPISSPLVVNMSFEEVQKIFEDCKKRDRFTGQDESMSPKTEKKTYKVVACKGHKFSLDIRKMKFEDGEISSIIMHADFPLKNDALKTMVGSVSGVEYAFGDYDRSKYEGCIGVGRLFDAETVRNDIEKKIKDFLD